MVIKRVVVSLFVLVFLVAGFFLITSSITKYTGLSITDTTSEDESEFKSCLNSKNIKLYINSGDTASRLASFQTSEYLDNVKVVNCFYEKDLCTSNDVESYPLWVFGDLKLLGDLSLEELQELSGC